MGKTFCKIGGLVLDAIYIKDREGKEESVPPARLQACRRIVGRFWFLGARVPKKPLSTAIAIEQY